MPIESGDYIFYEGNKMGTSIFPMYDYKETLKDKSKWLWTHEDEETWCLTHSLIKDDKFYIIYFEGHVKDAEPVGLDFFFPNQTEVFAYWFTDIVTVPRRFVKDEPLPKSKENVMELYLEFKDGILIKREFVEVPLLINLGYSFKEVDDKACEVGYAHNKKIKRNFLKRSFDWLIK